MGDCGVVVGVWDSCVGNGGVVDFYVGYWVEWLVCSS